MPDTSFACFLLGVDGHSTVALGPDLHHLGFVEQRGVREGEYIPERREDVGRHLGGHGQCSLDDCDFVRVDGGCAFQDGTSRGAYIAIFDRRSRNSNYC